MQVLNDRVQIKSLERLGIVELVIHRIGSRRMQAECAEVQLLRPPVSVAPARAPACYRAFPRTLVVSHPIHGMLASLLAARRSLSQTCATSTTRAQRPPLA